MRIVGRVKICPKKNRLLAEDFLGSHTGQAILCLGCMPGQPEPVSTPPRVRHRSKTMTSASVRPPALRKPKDSQDKEKERGRDKERQDKEKERGQDKEREGKEKERGRDKKRRQDKERGREKERHQGKGQDKKKRKAQSEDPKGGKAVVELMADAKKSKKEKEKKTAKGGKDEREAVETKKVEEKKKVEDSKKAETKTDETNVAKAPKKKKKSRAEKKSRKEKTDGKKKEAGKEKETGEEQKEGGDKKDTKRKKSPEPKVKFVPAQAPKIEHIFETPERKKQRETSPHANASASGSSSSLTSKQNAEQKLQELTALLNSSDGESSSCPATDIEQLMEGESEAGETTDSEDSSDEETKEKEETKDENKEGKVKEDEEVGNSSSSEEQESSEEEESDDKSSEEDLEESNQKDAPAAATGAAGATAPDPESHALVPVTKKTVETAVALRNSMSDKAAWDAFNRNARTKMPHSLADHYSANKTELFNLWLDSGRDWSKVELSAERIQQQRSISSRGYEAIQGKELRKRYADEAKYKAVIASRRQSGMFYQDDDFPDDEEDTYFSQPMESIG